MKIKHFNFGESFWATINSFSSGDIGYCNQEIAWISFVACVEGCTICYCLYNSKKVKNTHRGFSIGDFHIFKIVQMVPNRATHHL